MFEFALGSSCSVAMAYWAYRRRSLSLTGVVVTVLGGTLVFALSGWVWGLNVVVFFVAITAIAHYQRERKHQIAPDLIQSSRRGLRQAIANGGLAVILAMASLFGRSDILFAAFLGSMAAANGDTWSSELGMLSQHPPRMITTGRRMPAGTSGAVTLFGVGAGALGGLIIGVAAYVLVTLAEFIEGIGGAETYLWVAPLSAIAGLGGSLFDSLLGATAQAIFYCPTCQKETERKRHACGTVARLVRGWPWLDSDPVNFAASASGAVLAIALYLLGRSLL